MSGTLVSVVIPAYNAQAFIGECIASVQAQRVDAELEVVVVDDGSTDGTAAIVQQLPGVRLVSQPNRGPAAARNAGIAATRGHLVAFLDADDLWPEDSLAARLDVLQRHPDAAMVFGDCRQFDAQAPRQRTLFEEVGWGRRAWGDSGLVPDAYSRLIDDNFVTTGTVIVRRQVLDAVGGFAEDLRLVEDLELWLRIARHHPVAWCDRVCLLRRRHGANTSADRTAMGLAWLEVLRRQRMPADGARAAGLSQLNRAVAHECLNLCDLALQKGQRAEAMQWAWRSVWHRPAWRSLRGLAKAMLGAPGHDGAR